MKKKHQLWKSFIPTPLGEVIAISDECKLYLLEFSDRSHLKRQVQRVSNGFFIEPGNAGPIELIRKELALYFEGKLQVFTTPICMVGTFFQQQVWQELVKVGYGKTAFYHQVAFSIDRPKAYRPVAQAVAANSFAILIPCHRIIGSDGSLTGYAGGLERKQKLLHLEKIGRL